jgi:hemerythrin-like domain-containing protein
MSKPLTRRASNRPARPAIIAPCTIHEFEALDRTHSDVVVALRRLEKLVDRLEQLGEVDEVARSTASDLCEFFNSTARLHHEDEERVVFPPLLAGSDAELVQHVQRLQQDHGWLEQDWLEMEPTLRTIAEGFAWHEPALLREMAGVFCALYIEHIALEESIVYPASKLQLAAAEDALQRRSSEPV